LRLQALPSLIFALEQSNNSDLGNRLLDTCTSRRICQHKAFLLNTAAGGCGKIKFAHSDLLSDHAGSAIVSHFLYAFNLKSNIHSCRMIHCQHVAAALKGLKTDLAGKLRRVE